MSAKKYALQILSAVEFLHSANIVHLHVQPANVLIDRNGHAHLTRLHTARKCAPNTR